MNLLLSMADTCVFCLRIVPTRGHHVVPRCKGGREIAPACHSCEDFIHKTWTHNELRDVFNTVAKIRADERFQQFADPGGSRTGRRIVGVVRRKRWLRLLRAMRRDPARRLLELADEPARH